MGSSGLKTIADIFERRIYRIPDYQRGFSWKLKQISDFWEDIENLTEDRSHYTGVLTLERVDNSVSSNWPNDRWLIEKGYTPYYVVDGQQRLTSVVILLTAIIEKLLPTQKILYTSKKEIKEKYISEKRDEGISQTFIFGYEKDNPSYEFLKTKIFMDNSSSNQDIDTLYTANLEYAKGFFKDKIKDFDLETLETLFRKITLYLKFNVYEIDEELDVFVAFETMNNRGLGLSQLELMKNRLIYLSTLFEVDQYEKNSLRTNINNAWKTVYEYLGKNKEKPLDDDDFLKNHWILYFHYSRDVADQYSKFLLDEFFTPKKVIDKELSLHEIQKYILSIQGCVKTWYYIHNPSDSDYTEKTNKWLIKLNNLGFRAFSPLTMGILVHKAKYKVETINEVLKAMEKYIFLLFRISRRLSNTGDSEFYRVAREVYSENLSLTEVIEKIDYWIFGDNSEEGYYNINRFIQYLDEQFTRNKQIYYGWNGLKYLLYEYDYSLQEESKDSHKKINWVDFNKETKNYISIEHIFPESSELECWKKYFNKYTNEEKLKLCHTLGNLVPLSKKKNSSLQNDCFADKKHQKKGKVGYYNGSFSENEVAQYKEWTPKSIKERGLKILNFMENRWNINLGDDNEKLKLLHLHFLSN